MSPAMAMAQPVRNPCPAASAVARPVMGSTPKAIMMSVRGPALVPVKRATLRAVTALEAALSRARNGIFRPKAARSRRIGSKARARITSETKYSPVVIGHAKPLARASKTPAGIPPPTGRRNSFSTGSVMDVDWTKELLDLIPGGKSYFVSWLRSLENLPMATFGWSDTT